MDKDEALKTMIANMPEKTGKKLDEWQKILKRVPFTKHSEGLNYLKKEHGVTHGYANTIVALFLAEDDSNIDLVQKQYEGKEVLMPIYSAIKEFAVSLGSDVKVAPKKGSVSFVRKRQFILIKPATKKRIDLGLKLKGIPEAGRLGGSGPFGTMCTHRVQIHELHEVDDELKKWIIEAYEKAD